MLLQSWEPPYHRLVYTILCFTIQYLAPSVTVVLVYTRWVAGRVPRSPCPRCAGCARSSPGRATSPSPPTGGPARWSGGRRLTGC